MLLSSVNSFGGRGMNSSWDAIWEVESKLYDDSYIAEVKIPLNQLYFINGINEIGFLDSPKGFSKLILPIKARSPILCS